ncbi:flagellar basal body rod protein FlgC [Phycisphaerales bacterium AB-hyl4]|uniref:Flagellar basal-body rod protein FlgC n=1 Tax=Natronomicrosphaera hydrolytica TaxID=3242702 RepID=A0ABV4U8N4_9BACT
MFGSLDVSTSAMVAQRTRLEVISSNLANANSIYDADGNYSPFRRRMAIFAEGDPSTGRAEGVHVRDIKLDDSPFRKQFEPDHPHADDAGYVYYPNVDPTMERVNALEASRAYEANVTAAEATKAMMQSSLRLLA